MKKFLSNMQSFVRTFLFCDFTNIREFQPRALILIKISIWSIVVHWLGWPLIFIFELKRILIKFCNRNVQLSLRVYIQIYYYRYVKPLLFHLWTKFKLGSTIEQIFLLKIIFDSLLISLGDMGVGKSCILHQFTESKCTY